MDSVLRPRDIQARIRSGESPETVAAAAQTSVDKIMGFAAPVLAERAYVAEQALRASVRRRAGDGPVGHLGEAVEQRLADRDVDPGSVEWDAWRREDGRWTLVAEYPAGSTSTRAQFAYDVAGRYVVAEDDEARWLVGERSATPAGQTITHETVVETVFEPADRSEPTDPGSGAGSGADEQLPLGDDAIGLVTGGRPVQEPLAADDWMLTQATERVTPPREEVEEEPAATLFDTPAPGQAEDVAPAPDEPAPQKQPRKSGKSKRASVPSWDEIMFGSGKGE